MVFQSQTLNKDLFLRSRHLSLRTSRTQYCQRHVSQGRSIFGQTAKTTQKAGDMTMLVILGAICVLGALGAKYLKSKDKPGPKLYRGSRCDNMSGPSKAACLEARTGTKLNTV